MNKILIPTDFSEIAQNTLDYTVGLAQYTFAELILFHACYQPVFANDLTVSTGFYEQLEEDCKTKLEELKQKVLEKNPDLRVSWKYQIGLPADAINEFAREQNIDLIVMGTQGAGYLAEHMLGSIATTLLREAVCPVLIIDRGVKFRPLNKIVIAVDYKDRINEEALKPLKNFMTNFDAHLYVLHITSEEKTEAELYASLPHSEFNEAFKFYNHSIIASPDDNVINGINDFVAVQEADMVVMIPRKHAFFERIFRESEVKKMTFRSKVPLLVLHDNNL
ncbi:MAG: universal stress protein [Bacteroidota bacterium]